MLSPKPPGGLWSSDLGDGHFRNPVLFAVYPDPDAIGPLSFSVDGGATWNALGDPFEPRPGIWVGGRSGLFAFTPEGSGANGHADFPWWRVSG